MPSAPTLLAGRYRLGETVGTGGMGRVWLARDEVLDRDVAVKEIVIPVELAGEDRDKVQERALREARAAARLSHPGVVRVYDALEVDGRTWIVMEYVPSRSLQEIIRADGPLTPKRAAEIGLDVLSALNAAHRAGVQHRDVKPANVLIGDDGRVVLTDFGIAAIEGDGIVTGSGVVIGSPEYMSPERVRDGKSRAESDLWSLGATLYTAVEGRSPFHRGSVIATLTALAADEPDPPSRAGALRPVLDGLLRRDPAARTDFAETERRLRKAAKSPAIPRPRRSLRRQQPVPVPQPAPQADPQPPAQAVPQPAPQPAPPADLQPPAQAVPQPVPQVDPQPAPQSVPQPDPQVDPQPVPAPDSQPDRRPVPQLVPHSAPQSAPQAVAPRAGRRRGAIVVAAVVAAVIAATGAIWLGTRSDSGNAAGGDRPPAATASPGAAPAGTGPASTAPSGQSGPGGPAPGAASSAPSAGPASPRGTTPQRPPLPSGWFEHRDPTGFSVYVPKGWKRSKTGTIVYFRAPGGGRTLGIDQTTKPAPDPVADWRGKAAYRVNRGDFPGYKQIRIVSVRYWREAADWEFTFNGRARQHVNNRGFVVSKSQAYGLWWQTNDADWADARADLDLIFDSFRPKS
jgi:serine/threonine protein kinase